MAYDIINPEILDELKDFEITEQEYEEQNLFKSLDVLTEKDDKIIEDLLYNGNIPDKEFVKRIKLSGLGISLSLIQLAKKLAGKLQIIEKYLSKLEDKIFNDKTLDSMETGELLHLYQSTRILFERTEDMLMKIQEKVDVESVSMLLKALNAKENEEDEGVDLENQEDIDDIMQMLAEIKAKKAKEKLEEETKIK
jgi:hypothetical protein